jgi:translation initiation factor 1
MSQDDDGLVFSTDPGFDPQGPTPDPSEQKLKVRLEKKGRKGKAATTINGFVGKEEDLKELAKDLKKACGTGGSAKDGEIVIQGDAVQKVLEQLQKWGYGAKKAGG